jgi:hypothetical protein
MINSYLCGSTTWLFTLTTATSVTDSVKEAIHFKLLCEEAGIREPGIPLVVWEDNTACIHLGHGLRGSKSAKHFEVRLRFLNEQVHGNVIEFAKIDTKDQLADGFTKALPGLRSSTFEVLFYIHRHKETRNRAEEA